MVNQSLVNTQMSMMVTRNEQSVVVMMIIIIMVSLFCANNVVHSSNRCTVPTESSIGEGATEAASDHSFSF
jgi:hypothetical protein